MKKNVLLTIMMASMAAAPSFANRGSKHSDVKTKAFDLSNLATIASQTVEAQKAMRDKMAELEQLQGPNDNRSINDIEQEIESTQAALDALNPETTTPAE